MKLLTASIHNNNTVNLPNSAADSATTLRQYGQLTVDDGTAPLNTASFSSWISPTQPRQSPLSSNTRAHFTDVSRRLAKFWRVCLAHGR